jgi:phosphohistidine phosphatase
VDPGRTTPQSVPCVVAPRPVSGPYPAPVLVYLCRHAEAAPGDPDALRPLTAKGVEQAQRLAERLAREQPPPAIVLSSPMLRARQTAEAIARATGAEARADPRLAPGATVESLRELLDDVEGPVATVGHQPDCSEIVVALTGRDPGFAPASVHAIEIAP